MRRYALLATALPLLVVSAGCSRGETTRPPDVDQPIRVGRPAPDFTLPSAASDLTSLSDFTGKPVLLYFSMGPG